MGLPIGGVLGSLSWEAPSIFALCLIGLDFMLRVLVLEKHEIKQWAVDPDVALSHKQASLAQDAISGPGEAIAVMPNEDDAAKNAEDLAKSSAPGKVKEETVAPRYDSLKAIAYLLFHGKPLTGISISFVCTGPLRSLCRCS